MSDEDDREMRAESEDNDRFAGDKKTSGALHSKEANTRMNNGGGSTKMADEEITLEGMAADVDGVSKDEDDAGPDGDFNDLAGYGTRDIAEDVAAFESTDEAMPIAELAVELRDALINIQGQSDDSLALSKASGGDTDRMGATNDLDEIADELLELSDPETARALARVIVRTGDVVGEIASSIDDDGSQFNDRIGRAD